MLIVLAVVVVIIILIIVVSLTIGLTFKQFMEVAVATATIGGAIIVFLGFYYKNKEKKIANSMDRLITILDLMGQNEELGCVWTEIEGTATERCEVGLASRVSILKVLKEIDAALYSDRIDPSIHFVVPRLFKSPTIREEYFQNRYLFSMKFNQYVQKMLGL